MCFSAPASFLASGAMIATGVATKKYVKEKKEWLMAMVPFLFGLQQLIEGGQWLFIRAGQTNLIFGYGFLFFAFLLWPIYMPVATLLIEPNPHRKRLQKALLFFGFFVTGNLLMTLFTSPLSIEISNHHIFYNTLKPLSLIGITTTTLYVIATTGSLMISSHKYIRYFGILGFLFAVLSALIAINTFPSVWCFFAAILSILIFIHFKGLSPNNDSTPSKQKMYADLKHQ